VQALSRLTGVSVITIRRDLAELVREGLVTRVHGGALRAPRRGAARPASMRRRQDVEIKRRLAQATAEKFRRENVGLTLSVTPCWAYGTETIDMDRTIPHAIWGFNGSERPGAVYLAAALAGHTQLGIPAFGIYGEHVQDADDETIPEEVRQRLLDYAVCGLAVAQMKGRSYLSMGAVSMGIVFSSTLTGFYLKQRMQQRGINPYVTFIVSAFVASLCASTSLIFSTTSDIALATSVLYLVPGVPLINGVIDVVEGHVLTGFARLTEAALLIVNIAIGLSFTLLLVKSSLL